MKNTSALLIGILVVAAVVVGIVMSRNTKSHTEAMMKADTTMQENSVMMKDTTATAMQEQGTMMDGTQKGDAMMTH